MVNSREPQIIFDNVSKTYRTEQGETPALRDISFEVLPGEILSIVGQSGCGKTTLVNLIAGFVRPTSGRVLLNGRAAARPNRASAVVFQADLTFPWMTVYDNVAYGPRVQGHDNVAATVTQCLELVNLIEFAAHWPRELSGGMRKRVELARALAADTAILLLDEPYASLDVFTREGLQSMMLNLWRLHAQTAVLVTHDIEEAIFLGNRVMVLGPRPGSIRAILDVPFPMPRQQSIRLSPPFLEMRRHLATLVRGDAALEGRPASQESAS